MSRLPDNVDEHLDWLRLDAVRAGEGAPEDVAHAAGCATCRQRLAGLGALAEDLRRARPAATLVPANVEARILTGLRAVRRPVQRRRTAVWRWAATAAVAAGIVLAVGLWRPWPRVAEDAPPAAISHAPALDGDLNGDGAVDILDAFFLACRIEARENDSPKCDVNGDGRVDEADVKALADRAVALGGREG
jgi:hypothetical protein